MIETYETGLYSMCSQVDCYRERGGLSYHDHRYALSEAAKRNKRVGYKIKRVAVIDGHFVVTGVSRNRSDS